MTDWELMVPGIGLTVLGMAGVGLSFSGIAKTFLEGMHAVSALMMFIGMIILVTGILKDGLPNSNQAKAAALIIIGFLVTVGAFAAGIAEIQVLTTLTGILLLILVPAVVIAWAAHIKSPHFKALTILFSSASAVGIIVFSIFGLVAPQPIETGFIEQREVFQEEVSEPETSDEKTTVSISKTKIDVNISGGSANVANLEFYVPEELTVQVDTTIVWTNFDTAGHTVTSGSPTDDETGTLFDSGFPLMKPNEKYEFTFSERGDYPYFCLVHPWMFGKVIVT